MSLILRCLALLALFIPLSLAAQNPLEQRLLVASMTTIENEPALSALVQSLAEQAVTEHCAACHGADLQGRTGVPSLVDYDWLWAVDGTEVTSSEPIMKIMQSILYGIRDRDCAPETMRYGACPDTRYSEMPGYLQIFDAQRVEDLTEYVLDLAGREADQEAVARAQADAAYCVECHGEGGYGFKPYGGPDLTDDIWLYGGSREAIHASIAAGRLGSCPPFWDRLDAATIKALGVYLYRRSMGYE